MSKQKKPSKDEEPLEDEEEFEDGEEEEDEYDPEDVYEDDKEDKPLPKEVKLDLDKLSDTQRKVFDKNNKRMLFLKALALDVYQHVPKLAKKCGMTSHDAETCIGVIMGLIAETGKDANYPARILKYFNDLVPDGYPGKVIMDAGDVNELTNLFQVYEEKLTNSAKLTDPDAIFGDNQITDAKTINESSAQKKVIMSDSASNNSIPVDGGQVYPTPKSSGANDMEAYASMYPIPDIGLMEMALHRIPNPRPNSIRPFITSFTDMYTNWMANPMKMVEELKFFFGPTHGEHAFRLWKDYRDEYSKKLGYQPVGMGELSPYGFSGSGGLSPLQQNPYMSQEYEQERMMDKRMNKLTQILQLRMMDKAMEAQTPTPVQGQNYEEILDQNGKVIKRIFSNGNGHSSNPMESTLITTLTTIFKEMLGGANAEKIELLRKINTPDNTLQDLAKTMISNTINNQNPVSLASQYMEVAKMFNTMHGQGDNASKSIEAVKLDVDAKIAMQELELKKLEMQHNWRMDEKQTAEQDSNVDKWLNVLQQMGTDIVKPIAIKFVEGFGKGGMLGAPLGGMFGGAAPQNPMSEQEYAMQQQRYYQQQQQNIPPMQPMPPNPNRQYNPQQQQQQAQPQQFQQKPIAQLSEREIQEQLSGLNPEQVQELEDKLLIDDMSREKLKNGIRAYKNARRFNPNRQKTPQQVQEAENVLRRPQEPELNEDDLLEELEEEEYDVPIAAGQDRSIAQATEKQYKRKFSDFEQDSSSDISRTKKLSKQQEAMLSEGQLDPRELAYAEEKEIEDDDYGVPIAGIYNESDEKKIEENLKQRRQTPKKKKEEPKKEEVVQEISNPTVEEAEQVLTEAETEIIQPDEFNDV